MSEEAKKILRPFYMWAFIEALVFWYAIEKLLWDSVGITAEEIIVLGLLAQSGQILIEVPSSIIADRWSRRKTLIASSVFMALAIVIVLSIQSFWSFAIMSFVWALYYSFQSGTINAYIYDLLKEKSQQKYYRKALSRYATTQISGLLVSSLAATWLVEIGDFFTPYWITLLPTALAIFIMWRMHDPVFERTEQSSTVARHVKSSWQNIVSKRWLVTLFTALAFVTAGRFMWYEYYQLYALQLEVDAMLFGLMLVLIHIGNISGSELAHKITNPRIVLYIALPALLLSVLGLVVAQSSIFILALLALCFFGSQASTIVLDENLQHETPSDLRATTLSLAGLASRVIFGLAATGMFIAQIDAPIIALTSFVVFTGTILYWPIRKHLVHEI